MCELKSNSVRISLSIPECHWHYKVRLCHTFSSCFLIGPRTTSPSLTSLKACPTIFTSSMSSYCCLLLVLYSLDSVKIKSTQTKKSRTKAFILGIGLDCSIVWMLHLLFQDDYVPNQPKPGWICGCHNPNLDSRTISVDSSHFVFNKCYLHLTDSSIPKLTKLYLLCFILNCPVFCTIFHGLHMMSQKTFCFSHKYHFHYIDNLKHLLNGESHLNSMI